MRKHRIVPQSILYLLILSFILLGSCQKEEEEKEVREEKEQEEEIPTPAESIHNPKWMGKLPDERPIACITLPASHDALAYNMVYADLGFGSRGALCQNLSIAEQFEAGVRLFDFRIAESKKKKDLCGFHGDYECTDPLQKNFQDVIEKLAENPTEFVIITIQNEKYPCDDALRQWTQRWIKDYFASHGKNEILLGETFREDITLGKCRGKILIVWLEPWITDEATSYKGEYPPYTPYGLFARNLKNNCFSIGELSWGNLSSGSINYEKRATLWNQSLYDLENEGNTDRKYNEFLEYTSKYQDSLKTHQTIWFQNCISCYYWVSLMGIDFPAIAKTSSEINQRVLQFFKNSQAKKEPAGIILMNFAGCVEEVSGPTMIKYDSHGGELVQTIVDYNF